MLRTLGYLIGDAVELSSSSLVMSEATRLAMLNTAPDGIIVVDEAGAVLDFNPAAERIFGLGDRSAAIGRGVSETLVPPIAAAALRVPAAPTPMAGAKRVLGRRTEMELANANGYRGPDRARAHRNQTYRAASFRRLYPRSDRAA